MEDHTKHPHPNPHHGPGHETSDVNIWAIGKFAIALVIMTVLSLGLLIGLFRFFQSRDNPNAAKVDPVKTFPSPQLEQNEPRDLEQYRETEQKLLNGYAWVDPQKGVVSIPIDQAIDLLAKRGLPSRQQAPQAPAVSMPTESGLGQVRAAEEGMK
jgi:hypothetical protein